VDQVHFTKADCEILSEANSRKEDLPERGDIRDRLLVLDRALPGQRFAGTAILGLDLHKHWKPQNLTSASHPHAFNGNKVSEIFLRYGKSRQEMDDMDLDDIPKEDRRHRGFGSFPRHVHIAIGLSYEGFFYQVVIQPGACPDHKAMIDRLRHEKTGPVLFEKIKMLQADGYQVFFDEPGHPGLDGFASAKELGKLISERYRDSQGRFPFSIRKNVTVHDRVSVTSDNLSLEINRLFPLFELIARTSTR
jgi:hypothetical protein